MTESVGRPRTFDELMARHAGVALRLAGADRSNWDGTYEAIRERRVRGRARWNGKLQYHEKHVIGPLRKMYEEPGQRHSVGRLKEFRTALRTLLHENAHLLSAHDTRHMQGRIHFESQPATHALEEGVSELWAQRNLDRYIEALGIEEVAPGISQVREKRAYPEYTPAAAALVQGVAERSGQHPDEVLRRMNNVHPGQKWEVAANLIYDANGLGDIVPPERQAEVTRNIANAMRDDFQRNHPELQGRNAGPDRYAKAGVAAVTSAQREVDLYRATYGGGELIVDRQQDQSRHQPGPESRGGRQMNDLDHAMALYSSATPPLSTAKRLDASQFGSRRDVGTQAGQQQRQGPERGG